MTPQRLSTGCATQTGQIAEPDRFSTDPAGHPRPWCGVPRGADAGAPGELASCVRRVAGTVVGDPVGARPVLGPGDHVLRPQGLQGVSDRTWRCQTAIGLAHHAVACEGVFVPSREDMPGNLDYLAECLLAARSALTGGEGRHPTGRAPASRPALNATAETHWWHGSVEFHYGARRTRSSRTATRPDIVRRKELITRLLAGECEMCGQTGTVDVHHVRRLAELDRPGRPQPVWAQLMANGDARHSWSVRTATTPSTLGNQPRHPRNSHWKAG